MTVASAVDRNDYTGNGAASSYSYTFKIQEQDEIAVYTRSTADVETHLTLTTDFTVSGVGVQTGGTVSLVNGPLASGVKITILRDLSIVQDTALAGQRQFFGSSIEAGIDRLAMINQMINEAINRCIKFPKTDDPDLGSELPVSSTRASGFLCCDASGNITVSSSLTTLTVPTFTAGRILFATGAAAVGQSSSLFWDNASTLGRPSLTLGNGTTTNAIIKSRYLGDGLTNGSDAAVVGDGRITIFGHNANEEFHLTWYKYGCAVDFKSGTRDGATVSAIEFHGYRPGPAAYIAAMSIEADDTYSSLGVRNPDDTDGITLTFTNNITPRAFIYTKTEGTLGFGVANAVYTLLTATYWGSKVDGAMDLGGASNKWNNVRFSTQALGGNGTLSAPTYSFINKASVGYYLAATTGSGIVGFGMGAGVHFAYDGGNYGLFTYALSTSGQFGFCTGTDATAGTADVFLVRDGATGTVALKNGTTNACALRTYGTTSGSKYLSITHNATDGLVSTSSGALGFTPNSGIGYLGATTSIVTKGLEIGYSSIAGMVGLSIKNTDNTSASSHAVLFLDNGGHSGGNAYIRYTDTAIVTWTSGLKRTTDNLHFSVSATLGTNDALQLTFSQSVLAGKSAVATNATDGFLYIASNAGAPTGVPTAQTGFVPFYYDTTNNFLYVYNGGWKKSSVYA